MNAKEVKKIKKYPNFGECSYYSFINRSAERISTYVSIADFEQVYVCWEGN